MRVIAYIPIIGHLVAKDDALIAGARRVLRELKELGERHGRMLLPPDLDNWATPNSTTVSIHTPARSQPNSLPDGDPAPLRQRVFPPSVWKVVRFEVVLAFDEERLPSDKEAEAVLRYSESVAIELVQYGVSQLTFAGNLASPAAFIVGETSWLIEGHGASTTRGYASDLWMARNYVARARWPTLKELPLGDCLAWIWVNGLPLRAGDTPVSRAYNAYTLLFEENPLDLIVALHGVEALFVRSSSATQNQLTSRAQLLLGSRSRFKRDLSEMYSARSALLHGGSGFPGLAYPYEDPPAYVKRKAGRERALALAAAVLVATLQILVERKWSTLEFAEQLDGGESIFDYLSDDAGHEFVRFDATEVEAWVEGNFQDPASD